VDNIISVMIGSLLLCVTSVYMWRILYNEKYNYKNFKNYLVLIILIIFTSFNHIFVNNFVKVFTVTFALVLSNYFIFKKKNKWNNYSSFNYTIYSFYKWINIINNSKFYI